MEQLSPRLRCHTWTVFRISWPPAIYQSRAYPLLPHRSEDLQYQRLRPRAVPSTSQVHGLSLLTYVALVLRAIELDPQLSVGLVLLQLALKRLSSGLEPLPQLTCGFGSSRCSLAELSSGGII